MNASLRKIQLWFFILFIIMLCGSDLWAMEVPPLQARVNDHARMLSSSVGSQLETVLAELERTDGTQVVLLTIDSLKGDSLEDFSIRVVEKWKLGQKDFDNGVLLLIAKNDRKIRIEVGYGLEGKLTDLVSGRIIRNVIAPPFKMGRFDQGILDGISAIVGVVRGEYTAPRAVRRSRGKSGGVSAGLIPIIALIFFINMLGRIHRFAGAAAGGVLTPIVAAIFFNPGVALLLGLIPIGFGAGLLTSFLGGSVSFGHAGTRRHRSGYWGGGFGGGFGGGGFGGFSGGGGGFGGGGASGGW
jgi:uncharacterized protein